MPAVGLLTIELRIPGTRSLKDKRRVLASVKDRLRKLNISLAETDYHDKQQRTQLSIIAVATHRDGVDRSLSAALTEMERHYPDLILTTNIEWLN